MLERPCAGADGVNPKFRQQEMSKSGKLPRSESSTPTSGGFLLKSKFCWTSDVSFLVGFPPFLKNDVRQIPLRQIPWWFQNDNRNSNGFFLLSFSFSRNFVPQLCWSTYTTAHLHLTDLQMLCIAKIFRWFLTLNRQGKFDFHFPGKVSLKFDEDQHEMNNLVKWPFQWPFRRLSDPQLGIKSYFESHGNNIQLHFRKRLWKDTVALFWDESLCTHLLSYLFRYLVDVVLILKECNLSWCKTLLAWNSIVAASCTFWEAAWSSVFPDCAGEITYFLLMGKSHLSKQNVPSEWLQKLCGMRSIFSSDLRDCAAYRFAMQDANIESRSWIFFVDLEQGKMKFSANWNWFDSDSIQVCTVLS